MSWNDNTQPGWGQQPPTPPPPVSRPRWARKRIAIPAVAGALLVGIVLGSAASSSAESTAASAKPAPTVTVTVTAAPAKEAKADEPKPTVTVTKTVTAPPPAAKPKPKAKPTEEAPKDKVVFKVWGSAPAGVSIMYGSDSENLDGSGLPMTKTLPVNGDAMYYMVSAQLQGSGDIQCSVSIDGETKTGHARGEYNICQVQLNSDFFGGFS